jgi:uncharacterized protein
LTTPSSPESEYLATPLAVVTGASHGIGRSLAAVFAENGYDLVVAAEDDAIGTAAQELAATGVDVTPVQVDLATVEGVEELHRTATAGGRPVAAAALNVGVGVGGRFDETSLDDHLRLVDLNCRSTVHLAWLLVRDMRAHGEGRILVTSSVVSLAPNPYQSTYAASKAFTHSFAEGLRGELKDSGITVTSLLPGPTDTEFFERAELEDTKVGSGPKDDPDEVARAGYEALMAGKDQVVAGSFMNTVQAVASNVVPDRAKAAAMGKMTEPGSGS